jgi:RimJ/RimL family protein N-acetyltransferase
LVSKGIEAKVKSLKGRIKLRVAEEKDVDDTFQLTTQKDIRKISFCSDEITLKSHREWFLQKLSDSNCLFLIAEQEGVFIGQVRFDIKNGEAVVSISLLENFRGMGAGAVIFTGALKFLASLHPEVLLLSAYIKKDNSVSISFFSKLGFEYSGQIKINDINALQYRLEVKEAK